MVVPKISLLNHPYSYCVCMVDMIDSTKVIAGIAIPYKIRKYYSIFLNSMSLMIKKYGAIINKNVGDSLIYYFQKISDSTNKSAFKDVIEMWYNNDGCV